MVVCKRSIDKISITYRIMTLYYGYTIDTVHKLRQLVYGLNKQHVEDWCDMIWNEDFLFLDDELLSFLIRDISDYPVLSGNFSNDENDNTYWGEWDKTSVSDRNTFEKVANNPYWLNLESVDTFNYKEHLNSIDVEGLILYMEEKLNNYFLFEYDYRILKDSIPTYKNELKSRKLIFEREKKLNQIL